jgi:alkanesulfonate monooxygenase SsuD/methylene tetrahydromethanopterin reductase-like flavin-dependent oxidoreductase (luciferase family)
MSMPLGLSIASHSGLPPAKVGALAGAAELAGFSAVFVAEGHGDALHCARRCWPPRPPRSSTRRATADSSSAWASPTPLLGAHAWWLSRWLEPVVPNLQLEGQVALP